MADLCVMHLMGICYTGRSILEENLLVQATPPFQSLAIKRRRLIIIAVLFPQLAFLAMLIVIPHEHLYHRPLPSFFPLFSVSCLDVHALPPSKAV